MLVHRHTHAQTHQHTCTLARTHTDTRMRERLFYFAYFEHERNFSIAPPLCRQLEVKNCGNYLQNEKKGIQQSKHLFFVLFRNRVYSERSLHLCTVTSAVRFRLEVPLTREPATPTNCGENERTTDRRNRRADEQIQVKKTERQKGQRMKENKSLPK